ncbi:MAG: hypothetical protein DI582_02705 [Azospirillum brasilense]|nr:MAG: hypothetical protein DI582_02705 [Azospirillum brasilense]
MPGELYAQAEAYLAGQMQRAERSGKLVAFRPFSEAGQQAYLAEQFGDAMPEGLGVKMGQYVSLTRHEVTPQRRFIATDYLMDCHALILVGRNAQGEVQRTTMAHIDRYTDLAQAVPELLAQMPEGTRVEATIIGGPVGYNHYLQGDLLRELNRAPSVQRIRHGFDAGSTVAVDTLTGKVLVARTPEESIATSYTITELPLRIAFAPAVVEHANADLTMLQRAMADLTRTPATLPLQNAYDATRGAFIARDALSEQLYQLQADDQQLSRDDMLQLARSIGATLRTPVTIDYQVADDRLTTMRVRRESDNAELGVMYATAPEAALGRAGRMNAR